MNKYKVYVPVTVDFDVLDHRYPKVLFGKMDINSQLTKY